MANNFKDYVIEAMKEAGMNDDQVVAALDKIATNDKVGAKLNGILKTATEDYNAQVGRVQTLQQRNDYLEKDWFPKAQAAEQRTIAEYNKVLAELQRAQATGLPPEFDPAQYMTKADWETNVQTLGSRLGSVVKDVARVASRHSALYHEELDTQALDEIAVKMAKDRGLPAGAIPITDAYEEFIKPRKIAAEADARKKWETDTRAQIERDVRSQNHLPATAAPVEQSQMFRPTPKDEQPKDQDMDLLAHWNGTMNGAT